MENVSGEQASAWGTGSAWHLRRSVKHFILEMLCSLRTTIGPLDQYCVYCVRMLKLSVDIKECLWSRLPVSLKGAVLLSPSKFPLICCRLPASEPGALMQCTRWCTYATNPIQCRQQRLPPRFCKNPWSCQPRSVGCNNIISNSCERHS